MYTPVLLKVFVTRLCDLDNGSRLTTANALRFASDADRAATNADFDKVRTAVSQESEAFSVHNIASANFHGVAVVLGESIR